jgi:predicted metalloprotease with PDZ domain
MSTNGKLTAGVHYQVRVGNINAHTWQVRLQVTRPKVKQKFQLPVWIPGSYMVREFSKQLSGMQATQSGQPLQLKQLDKCTWEVQCKANQLLELTYSVHAHDHSVRTAWLDAQRGFFNGTSMFLQVLGQTQSVCSLQLIAPENITNWKVATALKSIRVDKAGFGVYQAKNYDELADSPVEMGCFELAEFSVQKSKHRIVITGAASSFDIHRLHSDVAQICNTIANFWHPHHSPPFDRYVFLLNTVSDGYGGLEHSNSTALLCRRKDLPQRTDKSRGEDYIGLLGLFSHEYFHAWNVKRLRPGNFDRYDYQSEQYTDMLWFFEGFTDYYDNLMLCRAELISPAQYLKLLNKSVQQFFQTPARHTHSAAQASFEAWTKYYRPDSNTPNITVSYYTKGSLIALCLDLSLRQMGYSLDMLMRELWQCSDGGPINENDICQALQRITGKSWKKKIHAWVHTVEEFPLVEILENQGIGVQFEASPLVQQLGMRIKEDHSIHIQTVLNGSAAQNAGFSAGDEWLGVEVGKGKAIQAWRIQRLDQLQLLLGDYQKCTALVARDGQLFRLPLSIPSTDPTPLWRLHIKDPVKVGIWLSGQAPA